MPGKQEQIKQKIAMELENARLWSAFLLPQIALFISLFFTEQYFINFPIARYILGSAVLVGIFFVILIRNEHMKRAHSYIEEL